MTIPVKPKLSATVILVTRTQDEINVYMTKRPESMKSYPGHFVFPGGKLINNDFSLEMENILLGPSEPIVDIAYYVAAARELYEETGILLCRDHSGRPLQPDSTWEDALTAILEGDISFNEYIMQKGYLLDIGGFHYFGHRITSPPKPYRFNTRFFLANLPQHQEPQPTTSEIETGLWIKPEEAIALHEKGKMNMVMPTIQSLTALLSYKCEELPMLPVIEYTKDYY
ncbi:NUDIX domain-containing protein [Neobacillus sp. MM2021_6]|uniref:NUDIX hydrolase n=1 Tax=Bacillaceae TaxID=186817 RepID=UPI0014085A17|nr:MULTISPECIES: NUDIX domain-containing protein [Bacillaceae]MBO0959991.1 NUDIX domain-containing protein [Neobacillus sp. MM2021_6]NHC18687.1 NUDIX domain-containing protein [Bacillus sp. MM2020_4]